MAFPAALTLGPESTFQFTDQIERARLAVVCDFARPYGNQRWQIPLPHILLCGLGG